MLNRRVSPCAIECGQCFILFADIPSGQFALFTSRDSSKSKTSFLVQRKSLGHSIEMSKYVDLSSLEIGELLSI